MIATHCNVGLKISHTQTYLLVDFSRYIPREIDFERKSRGGGEEGRGMSQRVHMYVYIDDR